MAPRLLTGLAELGQKPDIQARCRTFLGLDDVRENAAHLCRVPGHGDHRPSGVLRTGENGYLVYECLHAKDGKLKVYTLPDFYRAQLGGRALRREDRLTGPALMPWWERLLIEIGVLQPVSVPHRPIVEDAAPSVHQVYRQFIHLLACRWNYEDGQPTTFAVRFGMEWCDIGSHHTFREARQWLIEYGYIEVLPPYKSKTTDKALVLYRPAAPDAAHLPPQHPGRGGRVASTPRTGVNRRRPREEKWAQAKRSLARYVEVQANAATPIKKQDAEVYLCRTGLTRQDARAAIEAGNGTLWALTRQPHHRGQPCILFPLPYRTRV